jgi:protein SCO1
MLIRRRRPRRRLALWVRLGLLGALVGLMAFAITRSNRRSSGTAAATDLQANELPADYPRGDAPCPDFRLVDQNGAAFGPSRLRGTPTIVTFVFSHCQAICPDLVHDVRRAAEVARPAGVQLVLVTIDPVRDSPEVLPQVASEWNLGTNEWLLSGSPEEVGRLLDAFNVARVADTLTREVAHPPLVVVLDPQVRQAYRLNAPPVAWISEAVRRSRS